MPRVTPIAGKADVAPEHQAVVDDVLEGVRRGPWPVQHDAAQPGADEALLPLVPLPRRKRRRRQAALRRHPRRRAGAEAAYVWAAQVARRGATALREETNRSAARQGGRVAISGGRGRDRDLRPSAHAHQSRRPGRIRCAAQEIWHEVAGRLTAGVLLRHAVRRRQRVRVAAPPTATSCRRSAPRRDFGVRERPAWTRRVPSPLFSDDRRLIPQRYSQGRLTARGTAGRKA